MNKTASTQKSCCKHLPKKCLVIKNMLNKHIYKMCSSTSTSALIGKMVPSTFMFKNLKITKILYPACVTRISLSSNAPIFQTSNLVLLTLVPLSIVFQYSKLVIYIKHAGFNKFCTVYVVYVHVHVHVHV